MSTNTYEITETQWNRIKDKLPPERTGKPGRPCSLTNRQVLNGVLWIGHTGAQWKELPSRYGAKSTVHERFKSWKDKGILEVIFAELSRIAICRICPLTVPHAKFTNMPPVQKGGGRNRINRRRNEEEAGYRFVVRRKEHKDTCPC